MKIRFTIPCCAVAFALASPCRAITVILDPLSSDTSVYGSWNQRHLGSSSGTWFLPGGMLLELGLGRQATTPGGGSGGDDWRWENISCQFTATRDAPGGYPSALFFNHADDAGDDAQSLVQAGSGDRNYTFSFAGTYFPPSDEWSGTFSAVVTKGAPVPEGGGTFLLLSAALAGIHCVRRMLA